MTQKLIAIPLFCSYPSPNFEDSGPPTLDVKTENPVCGVCSEAKGTYVRTEYELSKLYMTENLWFFFLDTRIDSIYNIFLIFREVSSYASEAKLLETERLSGFLPKYYPCSLKRDYMF